MSLALLLGLFGFQSCGPSNLVVDGGLELWCGPDLCNWEVEEGRVEPAPTWHPDDLGVALIGDRVALSQLLELSAHTSECLELAVVHDGRGDAPLSVSLDFADDGTEEYRFDVPPSGFDRQVATFELPSWVEGPRIRIVKTGGPAVLGAISIGFGSGSCEPIQVVDRPLGVRCEGNAQCTDTHCTRIPDSPLARFAADGDLAADIADRMCSSCGDSGDCVGGEVCGASPDPADRGVFAECVPPASRSLGEQCIGSEECGTGTCCQGRCSECCTESLVGCPEGAVCRERTGGDDDLAYLAPFTCAVAGGREAGAPCLATSDCASGQCEGSSTLSVCSLDRRTCTADEDCPPAGVATCEHLGVRDGVCL